MIEYSLSQLLRYFAELGATAFGGPIVLIAKMQRDLVENRKWISEEEFDRGLTLAQLSPGPVATQLAIYFGWAKSGVLGATLVAIVFLLPSLLAVLLLSYLYVRYSGLPWIQKSLYGIGAAVIAFIAQSAYQLGKKTLRGKPMLAAISILSALYTIVTESQSLLLFLLAGVAMIGLKRPGVSLLNIALLSLSPLVPEPAKLKNLFLFFFKAGAMVFGSGFAVIPYLRNGVVTELGWLTEQQFLDSISVAMVTPGPVVITAAFMGYLVAGISGGLVAAVGMFLPCYLVVILIAPFYLRFAKHETVRAFVDGVTSSALGAILGGAVLLAKRSLIDLPTLTIVVLTLVLGLKFRKVPDLVFLLIAGLVGFLVK